MNNKVCKLVVLAWHAPPPPAWGLGGCKNVRKSLLGEEVRNVYFSWGVYCWGGGGRGGSRNFEVKIKIA